MHRYKHESTRPAFYQILAALQFDVIKYIRLKATTFFSYQLIVHSGSPPQIEIPQGGLIIQNTSAIETVPCEMIPYAQLGPASPFL